MTADQELVDGSTRCGRRSTTLGAELDEAEWKRDDRAARAGRCRTTSCTSPHIEAMSSSAGPDVEHDAARRPAAREELVRADQRGVRRLAPIVVGRRRARRVPRRVTRERVAELRALDARRLRRRLVDADGPGHRARPAPVPDLRLVGARAGHAAGGRPPRRSRHAGRRSTVWEWSRRRCRSSSGRRSALPTVRWSCSRRRARSRATSSSASSTVAAGCSTQSPDDPTRPAAHDAPRRSRGSVRSGRSRPRPSPAAT